MTLTERLVDYDHNGTEFQGLFVCDSAVKGPVPVVLVGHAWAGRTDYEAEAARNIAKLGYAAFAYDLYGKGVVGTTTEECNALMTPLVEDRAMLHSRLLRSLEVAKDQSEVDGTKAAAMGYCFGGLCVLDLARIGADVLGVASFHGLLNPPSVGKKNTIEAKVIVFHGYDDPMAKPEDMVALANELTEAKADWQILALGGTMHAFTNPNANDPSFGTVYSEKASNRSSLAFTAFLEECFA
ncbi:MAG: dienelactone hydrolase family protein [Pseudomonadota bacterium]